MNRNFLERSREFFPIQPRPARVAQACSITGAESTKARPFTPGNDLADVRPVIFEAFS